MSKFARQFFLSAPLGALALASAATADEQGNMQPGEPYPCANDTVGSIVEVCKAVKQVLPFIACPQTTSTCAKARQQIFTGLTGETASPTNIKAWNGQGVTGEVFQSIGLCLLRDLNSAPMKSHAEASLPIGTIAADSVVDYMSFNKVTKKFKGSHRLTAHAPVIGDVDIMTQVFTADAVNKDLKGQGKTVGQYAVAGAHALDFEADGGAEDFSFELDAITITTPYGTVTPKPHLKLARASFWSLSPFGGAKGLTMNPGGFLTIDTYGTLKGQSDASALSPFKLVPEPKDTIVGLKYCGIVFQDKKHCVAPSPVAWDSQLMLGARNVDPRPSAAAWTAPAGQSFPLRPDAIIETARGAGEKLPNGFASAGVKIVYNPVGMIPAALLSSGFITPTIEVFVDPNIAVGFASQFNFWNAQASVWNPSLSKPPPAPAVTPVDVESQHAMTLYGGASVAGRFAIDAGVDLTLAVHISLPWPLDDIDFNIIDVHPRTAFLETIDADEKPADRTAFVMSNAQAAVKTGKPFQLYATLTGGQVDGFKHLTQCFADPAPPDKTPDAPKYAPGDKEDLVEIVDMPCNFCAGYADFTYLDVKTQSPLTFQTKVMKGQAEKFPPVDDSAFSPADKWTCGGALPSQPTIVSVPGPDPSQIKTAAQANAFNEAAKQKAKNNLFNAGCYDQCRVDKASGKFKLIASAKKLYASGVLKDAPNGCH